MDNETCYIFKPETETLPSSRPAKRRKVDEPQYRGLQVSWPQRKQVYNRIWRDHEDRLEKVFNELNETAISQVSDYITNDDTPTSDSRIKSAILLTGLSGTSHADLAHKIHLAVKSKSRAALISLQASDATNLKGILKKINTVTSNTTLPDGDDEDDDQAQYAIGASNKRLLSYDLQISQEAVHDQKLSEVIIDFQNCEEFDGSLLSEVIEVLSYWKNRIPFCFIFEIATTIEALQYRLSSKALRSIRAARFNVANSDILLEKAFTAIWSPLPPIVLGSSVAAMILQRQKDYLLDIKSLVSAVQYSYMSHFYANAVSLFLDEKLDFQKIPKDHFEAVRNLPSFMSSMEYKIDHGQAAEVKQLLESDGYLYDFVRASIDDGHTSCQNILDAARLYQELLTIVTSQVSSSAIDNMLRAMSGSLQTTSEYKNLCMLLRCSNPEVLRQCLNVATSSRDDSLANFAQPALNSLSSLLQDRQDGSAPLSISSSSLRTAVVAKKIELRRSSSQLTKSDSAFSEILSGLTDALEDYFDRTLIQPKSLVLHELFLFDLKSPSRQVFAPKPRFVIERALSTPHDYLACDCCAPDADVDRDAISLSSSQPATAILYQFYLESGALINICDLRDAFATLVGETIEDEELVSALFQRSLAELYYLGMLKHTKKKADHALKIAWKGL